MQLWSESCSLHGFKPQISVELRYLYFHRKKDDGTMEDMAAGQDAELEVKTSGWWWVGIRGYHSSITLLGCPVGS